MAGSHISENSRRIARNTVLLYFRMGVMLLVGLYTSRVVLGALGQDDYGTFDNESNDRAFWKRDTRYTLMGGETCKVSDYCKCA